jgi:hypothetical protein
MADDKSDRDKQARDAERRQRERDIATEVDRRDESEPPIEAEALEGIEFPATGAQIVATIGDSTVESAEGNHTIEELIPETDEDTFDSPAAVRVMVRRPSVAAAMKRVVEASGTLPNVEFSWSQRKAYELTFQALISVDADDDDEGITAISDWIVERIREKETLPTSRAVRRQAAKFCRSNGYQVRDDEWLGI